MRIEARKLLYDMQRAAALLTEFTAGKTFADCEREAMMRAAVEREFEIVGEAMTQLARVDEAVAASITHYQRIIAFRNVLIHGYANVDDELVWNVVETRLPTLVSEIDALLEKGDHEPGPTPPLPAH